MTNGKAGGSGAPGHPRLADFIGVASWPTSLDRTLDVVIALAVPVLVAPVLVLIALAIWLQDFGHPMFSHRRVGYGRVEFSCLKVRSIVVHADARLAELLTSDPVAATEWALDYKLSADPRITRLGGWLRKSSLNELPQLFNVLAGDMSLVGPRPIVPSETTRYGRYLSHYYSVRPGITGLWQVSGRNDLSYRSRVALDTAYVRARSMRLSVGIIFRTLAAVLSRRGFR